MDDNSIQKKSEELQKYISSEALRISKLPPLEQTQQFQQLHSFAEQAKNSLKAQASLQAMGVPAPQEETKEGEGFLGYVGKSLSKPISAVAYGAEALTAQRPEDRELGLVNALKSATPFYETITGENVPTQGIGQVLEKAGVGEMGRLSDVLPIFGEKGSGSILEKEGALDVTGRGAIGLAGDIGLDPTNLLFAPLKAVSLGGRLFKAGKLMDKSIAGLAAGKVGGVLNTISKDRFGKDIYTIAYENNILNPLTRLFNKYRFLGPEIKEADEAKTILKDFETGVKSIGQESINKLAKNQGVREFIKKVEVNQDKLVPIGQKLDDITTAIKNSKLTDYDKLGQAFPEYKDFIHEAFRVNDGKFDLNTFKDIFLARQGLNKEELFQLSFMREWLDNKKAYMIEKGLHTAAELDAHPFFFPRQIVDFTPIIGNDGLIAAKLRDPKGAEIIEKAITSAKERAAAGEIDSAINGKLFGNKIGPSTSLKQRVYENAAETASIANAVGSKLQHDIAELMFKTESDIAYKELEKKTILGLQSVFGTAVPKEVIDTFKQIAKKSDPNSIRTASRLWNKWFLNPFKKSVTLPFPGFLIRNIIDNTITGYHNGGIKLLNPILSKAAYNVVGGGDAAVDIGNGLSMHASQLQAEGYNLGVLRFGSTRSDLMNLNDSVRRQLAAATPGERSLLKNAADYLSNGGEYLNTWMDNHARAKSFISGVQDYVTHHDIKDITSPKFQEALRYGAKQANKAFFDYRELGPMDDMLAQVIPFYRFTRKNIPMQIENLITNPHRMSTLFKAENAFNANDLKPEEEAALAPYLKENLHLSLSDNDTGEHLLLSGTGLRMEQLNQIMSSEGLARTIEKATIGQAASPLQYIYSYITNRNPFFGTELTDYRSRTTNKAFYENPLMRNLVGGIEKQPIRVGKDKKVEYRYELQDPDLYAKIMTVISPTAAALATHIPVVGTLAAGAVSPRGLSTIGMLSDARLETDIKVMKLLTGLKISKIDLNKEKMRKLYDITRKEYINLREHLRRKRTMDRVISDALNSGASIDEDVLPGIKLDEEE